MLELGRCRRGDEHGLAPLFAERGGRRGVGDLVLVVLVGVVVRR